MLRSKARRRDANRARLEKRASGLSMVHRGSFPSGPSDNRLFNNESMTAWSTPLLRILPTSKSRSAAAEELNERIASLNNASRRLSSSDATEEAAVSVPVVDASSSRAYKDFAVGALLTSSVFDGGEKCRGTSPALLMEKLAVREMKPADEFTKRLNTSNLMLHMVDGGDEEVVKRCDNECHVSW